MAMSRAFKWTVGAVLVLAFWLITPLYSDLLRPLVLKTLAVGWFSFLRRNASAVTWDGGLIFTGLVCSVGVVLLSRYLLGKWTPPATNLAQGGSLTRRWRWRWALGIYGGLWVLFMLAIAVGGLYSESRWLKLGKEPWFERVENVTVDLRIAAGMVEQVLLESGGDVRKARQTLVLFEPKAPWLERFNIILYETASGTPPAWVIIPRKAPRGRADYFCVDGDIRPVGELANTLARLDAERAGSRAGQGATDLKR